MNRQQRKSVSEFVRLTEPCQRQIYGIALSLCHDRDKAADLAQETLVRAFEAFDQFVPGSPMLPWLRRILRNLFLDSFKTGRSRHEITEADLSRSGDLPIQAEAEDASDPMSQLERNQLSNWVREEMALLPPEHQQVLSLCVMNELGFKEAAELTGLPVGTIASRLARARARLRERMLNKLAALEQSTGTDANSPLTRNPIEPGSDGRPAQTEEDSESDRANEASR